MGKISRDTPLAEITLRRRERFLTKSLGLLKVRWKNE